MMTAAFNVNTYITGWSVPDEFQVNEWLKGWQSQHYQDHENMYSALESLEKAVNNVELELDISQLGFDPERIESINDFMILNRQQHSNFYQWMNLLGSNLAQYNIPPIVIYPKINITGPILEASGDMWARFMEMERAAHVLTLSGINQIYTAFQLASSNSTGGTT